MQFAADVLFGTLDYSLSGACRDRVASFQRARCKALGSQNLDKFLPDGGRGLLLPEFPEPRICILWRNSEHLENMHRLLSTIETYLDESHHIRRLMKCRECGQLYFYEFLEFIDYVNGDDPQYRTYIPVTSAEHAAILTDLPHWELATCAPAIHSDWPKEQQKSRVAWAGRSRFD
jgi:hypothetical protein